MIKRRDFLKFAGAGSAGIGLPLFSGGPRQSSPKPEETTKSRIRSFRELGKTGLKLSDIGHGVINLNNPSVLRFSFDCGVNHFDTAEGYLNTRSEEYLGTALKDIRKNVIITSKYLIRTPADLNRDSLAKRLEASLKRLQTDYLDIALVHSVDQPEQLDNDEIIAAYSRFKKEGKARHIGFSTHAAPALLEKAIEAGIWEVALLIYNHIEGPKIEPLIAKAKTKGIGIIAMKVFAGGLQGKLAALAGDQTRYPQAAIRWVLGNPRIDACILTMSTFSHVEDYLQASGTPLQRADLAAVDRYRREADTVYCRVSCRECIPSCPHGVAINEVLRYAMYYENYGMEANAMQLYRELPENCRPSQCASCPAPCDSACPHGLDIPGRLAHSHRLLGGEWA